MNLEGKKILFIGPVFHHYHSEIISVLEKYGASVDFYNERYTGVIFKFINNFGHKYLDNYQLRYYQKLLVKIKKYKYDYLLVIRGYKMPKQFIQKVKVLNPGIKTIMYQWDSQLNNNYMHLIEEFDIVKSFDYEDCEKFIDVEYLPLFYTSDILKVRKSHESEFKFLFFGWYMWERYLVMKKLIEKFENDSIKYKIFLFMPYSSYIKEKYLNKKDIDKNYISFTPMNREEYIDVLSKSEIVIDYSSSKQTGLSMRQIEAIGGYKKLITSNNRIKEERFYHPHNIAVLNSDKFDDLSFELTNEFDEIKNEEIENYCIENWINNLFNIK